MKLDTVNEQILRSDGFEKMLGIEFLTTEETDTCMARMHVGRHLLQPFGTLSGGAVLALAESLSGAGSCSLRPDCRCVGISVSANHVHPAREGETLTALGRLVQNGGHIHVWKVDVSNDDGTLISTVTVTNYVKKMQICQ